jgi:hypothetical protein
MHSVAQKQAFRFEASGTDDANLLVPSMYDGLEVKVFPQADGGEG